MPKLTVKDLRDCKGKRQISFVQVTSDDQVLAAADAGMDMIGTGFRDSAKHFPGLVPDSHFQLGLAYGKHASPEEALRDAFTAMECGADSILLTISLGSGNQCDIQYLFSADLLGENPSHIPRHAKAYRNLAEEYDRLQVQRVAAYREYIEEVNNGKFPASEHLVNIDKLEFDSFLSQIDNL